jgi:hypothetical protein
MRVRTVLLVNTLALLLVAGASPSLAQFDQFGRWDYHEEKEPANFTFAAYSREQADELVKRWAEIGEMGDRPGWEGDFIRGDGEMATSYCRLDPEIGYVRLTTHSCMPDVREFDYGSVEDFKDRIVLRPDDSLGKATTLLKVVWGDRRYLVEEDRIARFAEFASGRRRAARDRWDPWSEDNYFQQEGAFGRDVADVPSLPDEYVRFVKEPIFASITAVTHRREKRSSTRIVVTLDKGKRSGIERGMVFYLRKADSYEDVWVEEVGETWCRASAEFYGDLTEVEEAKSATYAVGSDWTTSYMVSKRSR